MLQQQKFYIKFTYFWLIMEKEPKVTFMLSLAEIGPVDKDDMSFETKS